MYTINKTFNIAYGHSVWAQSLNSKLSIETNCACKYFHGHNADVTIFVETEELDYKGMVLDFKELTFAKVFLDTIVDHKMIIDINDPALPQFFPLFTHPLESIVHVKEGDYYLIRKHLYKDLTEREKQIYEGLIIVDFIPTAENLAKWIFMYVKEFINDARISHQVTVKKVQMWETPKCCAEYSI